MEHRFIALEVEERLAVVKFHYAPNFRFEDYEVIEAELNAVADADIKAMIINLDAMEYLSSRLLGMITSVAARMRESERTLVVCRLRPEALRAFKLTRLDSLIPQYPSEEEARQALT